MTKIFEPGDKVRFPIHVPYAPCGAAPTFRSGVVVCSYETTHENAVAELLLDGETRSAIYGTVGMELA